MPVLPETATRRDRLSGYACAVCVTLIWAGFALASRYGVRAGARAHLTPFDLGALRFAVSGAVAAAPPPPPPHAARRALTTAPIPEVARAAADEGQTRGEGRNGVGMRAGG